MRAMPAKARAEASGTGLILAAAGSGRRLGAGVPKAFVKLAGEAMLVRSARSFVEALPSVEIVVAAPPGHEARARRLLERAGLSRNLRAVVAGGRSRQESVLNALRALGPAAGVVLIHDAARPLVNPGLILRVARAAREHGAAVPCVPLADTVKEVTRGHVRRTLDRSRLVAAQTPQGFRRELLEKAFRRAGRRGLPAATDDASLVERIVPGGVCVVEGDRANVKVTTPEDLAWCEFVLSRGAKARRREQKRS